MRATHFFRTPTRHAAIVAGLIAGLIASACSFLINPDATQCSNDSECTRLSPNSRCDTKASVCVFVDGGVVADVADVVDADGPLEEPKPEASPCLDKAGFEGRGCYTCVPDGGTNPVDLPLTNQCVAAGCSYFYDNALKLPANAASMPLPGIATDAPTSTSTPTPPPNTGLCKDVAQTVIYVKGSSGLVAAQGPIFYAFAAQYPGLAVVYQETPSCEGAEAIFAGKGLGADTALKNVYWTGGMDLTKVKSGITCNIVSEQRADVGLCDVPPERCGYNSDPSQYEDKIGATQVFSFVVPKTSTEEKISKEAARLVFGMGTYYRDNKLPDGSNFAGVPPWTDEKLIFRRFKGSGNQIVTSTFIDVPKDQVRGVQFNSGGTLVKTMQAANTASSTQEKNALIGVSSGDKMDDPQIRGDLKVLAFQVEEGACAFLPDSSREARDKIYVRNGQYYLHAPMHLFIRTADYKDASKHLEDLVAHLNGGKILDKLTSVTDQGAIVESDYVQLLRAGGLVPPCAMHVERTGPGEPLKPYSHNYSCDCAYENSGAGSCTSCSTDIDCRGVAGRPVCRFQYCEAK